jgi:hypothetical protein
MDDDFETAPIVYSGWENTLITGKMFALAQKREEFQIDTISFLSFFLSLPLSF